MAKHTPAAEVHISYCPQCGRTDKHLPFHKGGHSTGGKLCKGVPKVARYVLKDANYRA